MKTKNSAKVLSLTLLTLFASCNNDDDKESVITAADLPETAQTFVEEHFPDDGYRLVKKQKKADADGSIYDVTLTNNFEIDFDIEGNWVDVDGNYKAIPAKIIPKKIIAYLTENYPEQAVTSIDNEKTHIEIELQNRLELIFDLEGNFIRIDK